MTYHKRIIYNMIGIFIIFILLTNTLSISANQKYSNDTESDVQPTMEEYRGQSMQLLMNMLDLNSPTKRYYGINLHDTELPFNGPGDQITPEIIQTESGVLVIVYYDCISERIHIYGSTDEGNTWTLILISIFPGLLYPEIDNWDLNRVFITTICPPFDHEGGFLVIGEFPDILNPQIIKEIPLNANSLGFFGNKDACIACDNSQNWWEFGVAAYILSYQNEQQYSDFPFFWYRDPNNENHSGWFWYLPGFERCGHCDNDIDRVTHLHYAAYDYYNLSSDQWNLLILQTNFSDPLDSDWWGYYIDHQGDYQNLQRPVVSAYDDHLIILCEYEKDGNSDIICYHIDKANRFYEFDIESNFVFIANTSDQEYCPTISHVEHTTFVASFVKNGDIYTTWTMDGGANWTPPFRVNENQGLVTNTYESSDLWYPYLIWEEQHQDIDISIAEIFAPPTDINIHGRNSGRIGKPYEITISATQTEGLNISYFVDWGDGTNTSWSDLTPSGEPITANHIYDSNQTYQIRVKARNEQGVEGHWAHHDISVPKVKEFITPFYRSLEVPSSKWLIGADQMQIKFTGISYSQIQGREYAQAFTPTKDILTAVALYYMRIDHPDDETTITISIREELDGSDLTNMTILAWDYNIKGFPPYTWVLFDFPDITINPGQTYYIHETVSHGEPLTNSYGWNHDINDSYSKGEAWIKYYDHYEWKKLDHLHPHVDFCFITYHQEPKTKIPLHPILNFLEEHPHLLPILRILFKTYLLEGAHL